MATRGDPNTPPTRGDPADLPTVLVLTPMKDAVRHLDTYLACLRRLEHPAARLSLGILESDSRDGTWERLHAMLPDFEARCASVRFTKKDYGLRLPEGAARWAPAFQIPRRRILAKSRNRLLFHALRDEDWVLWLDVDVVEYPADLLHRLFATGRDILHPHCVRQYGGKTFDLNAWRDHGKVHMDDMRGGAPLVRLDAVGGTVLLVRADLHREGLVFPPFLYGRPHPSVRHPGPWGARNAGEIETEGLGLMASDMGHQCWGLPDLEVLHSEH